MNREVMSDFDYGQYIHGYEGEYDTIHAMENEGDIASYEETHGDMIPEQTFSQLRRPYRFSQTQSQFWQSPTQRAFAQNGNFTSWERQQPAASHFPVASQSSGNMPFLTSRQPTSDTTFSTPSQTSYQSPSKLNGLLDEVENNYASSSDHKMKKQRIYAPLSTIRNASVPKIARQASQSIASIAQVELPYRNIWRMQQFNRMQSEMVTELLQNDENVVVTAPTGAGKTVLFEMALVRMFQKYKDGKAVYLAPTKALCSEKFRDWSYRLKAMDCGVLEMTGDSKITTHEEVKAARLIIATPEKWDFITRRAARLDPLMSKLKLFLIDEVHSVREKVRGALLEVLIARTKSRDPDTRIIAVSATIPNADDIAEWIGSRQRSARDKPETRKLTPFVFSEDFRPCPLRKEIYGFKPKSINESYYDFEKELTKQIPNIIEEHSMGKATLIFCSSRSGTQQVAAALKEYCQHRIEQNLHSPWPKARKMNGPGFSNEELQDLSSYGIAFHHAGLDISDKRMVENAFLKGSIMILCATTTLAVGVNLPAYMVIIRGTKLNTGVFEEHSDLTIFQMMGRAGRPGFDTHGVCVIMTEQDRREHYEQLLKGENIIESTLHLNLAEHINAEVCARGRCRAYNIEKWLKETFLFTRMSKNWAHYNIEGCSAQSSPEENVRKITRENLESLSKVDLIENYDSSKPEQEFNSTEYGRTMANYSLRMRTMIELMNLQEGASMQSLISTISQANEFSDLFIRAGEKVMYSNILRDLRLRFPPTRVDSLHEKVSVLLQLGLTGFKVKEITEKESKTFSANSNNEQAQIFKTAPKIARAMMNIAIYRKDGAFLHEAFMLSRSLNGKSWDDEPATLTQLDGVGPGTMQLLSQHNIKSIKALAKASPAELAMMICKTPTQASRLINDAKKIPQINFEAREVNIQPKPDGSVESTIRITIHLAHSPAEMKKLRLQTREGKAISIGTIIYSTNVNARECHLRRAGIWNFTENGQSLEIKCHFLTALDEIVIVCAAEDISGSSVTKKVKTSYPADRFPLKNNFVSAKDLLGPLRENETEMLEQPVASTGAVRLQGTQKEHNLKQNGKVPSSTARKKTAISRETKATANISKKSVNIEEKTRPVIEKEQDVSFDEINNEPQSISQDENLRSNEDESLNLEADGIEIVAVKRRKYTRRLPTVKQMKFEYDTIKEEWIKMKKEKGEQIEENQDYLAFKAIKEEDAKTRTKRHYKRKYPPPAIMKAELEQMKEDLHKFRGNQGQPSGSNADACAWDTLPDNFETETSGAADANEEKDVESQGDSENEAPIEKGKRKECSDEKVKNPSKIYRKGKGKEMSNFKKGKTAQREAEKISTLPLQSVQSFLESASGSISDQDGASTPSDGEVETLLQDGEEECSDVGSDGDFEKNEYFSDNDNDLFTDNLLEDDLVAFCNMNEMRDIQVEEDEDEMW